MSLDGVIRLLQDTTESDKRAEEILATAITLRDSTGRDRKQSIRSMATSWGVARYENRKDRSVSDLAKDMEAAVCNAASTWRAHLQARGDAEHVVTPPGEGSCSAGARPSSRDSEDTGVKKARTSDAADHTVGPTTRAGGTLVKLPETPQDVISLRRLGVDTFEATQRSGTIWSGDATLLGTLPQGQAKLATLLTREVMARAKAKAKAKAKAEAGE